MFCITEQVVYNIVGHHHDGDLTEYAICLGCNKPKVWIELDLLKGFLDTDLLLKKQALDAFFLRDANFCRNNNIKLTSTTSSAIFVWQT